MPQGKEQASPSVEVRVNPVSPTYPPGSGASRCTILASVSSPTKWEPDHPACTAARRRRKGPGDWRADATASFWVLTLRSAPSLLTGRGLRQHRCQGRRGWQQAAYWSCFSSVQLLSGLAWQGRYGPHFTDKQGQAQKATLPKVTILAPGSTPIRSLQGSSGRTTLTWHSGPS